MRVLALTLIAALGSGCSGAAAAPAPMQRTVRHEGASWLVFELDLAHVQLTLVGQREGEPFTFAALPGYLATHGQELVMATNAGIFSPERRPMGLHVQDGELLSALSTAAGEGNFFLQPNGVFWLDDKGAHVAASADYAPHGKLRLATQSGPLLLRGGRIHPAFRERSTSLKVRSGVGVDARGHVVFALSLASVPFHAMATLFRDALGCRDALYLDGEISGIAAPGLAPPPALAYGGLLVATRR
jgi:uncharacterized protein YigE (DUF2233 family)